MQLSLFLLFIFRQSHLAQDDHEFYVKLGGLWTSYPPFSSLFSAEEKTLDSCMLGKPLATEPTKPQLCNLNIFFESFFIFLTPT